MERIIEMALGSGIWAALFVWLFFVQIKDAKTRESKYQQTIAALAEKFEIVKDIHDKIESLLKTQ